MTGSELRCLCGAGTRDVAPDFDPWTEDETTLVRNLTIFWYCTEGHANATHGNGVTLRVQANDRATTADTSDTQPGRSRR